MNSFERLRVFVIDCSGAGSPVQPFDMRDTLNRIAVAPRSAAYKR